MINQYMDFYPGTVFDQSTNLYQFPYNIHYPMNLLFEKKVETYFMTNNNNIDTNTTNNTMKRKYDQANEEDDLFLYNYQSDNYMLEDIMEIKKEDLHVNTTMDIKQQQPIVTKRHKSSLSASSSTTTNTAILKNEQQQQQALSMPSPTNTVTSSIIQQNRTTTLNQQNHVTTINNNHKHNNNHNKPTEQQKDIIKLENNLHYLQDEWATIDIVLNSLRSVFTVYPTRLATEEYLDDIDKELSIAYDDLMAQVRSLDRNLKRLDVKIKSCHEQPTTCLANALPYSDYTMQFS
ncbi:unnamed protein product [Cunninghamella blakesleeana]